MYISGGDGHTPPWELFLWIAGYVSLGLYLGTRQFKHWLKHRHEPKKPKRPINYPRDWD